MLGGAGLWVGPSVVLLIVLLAGCSGEERLAKREYEQKVRTLYAGVQNAFESTRGASGASLARRVAEARAQLRAAAAGLDEIEPPKQVEEADQELVEGLRAYAEDLETVERAAERNDVAAIARFNAQVGGNEAVEQIAEAAEEMTHKGYDLGRIANE